MSFVADSVAVGILAHFQPKAPNLPAIEKSVEHASAKLQIAVEAKWIPTPSVLEPNGQKTLESFDGIWAAPGSPYKSFDGMLKGIEFARRRRLGQEKAGRQRHGAEIAHHRGSQRIFVCDPPYHMSWTELLGYERPPTRTATPTR